VPCGESVCRSRDLGLALSTHREQGEGQKLLFGGIKAVGDEATLRHGPLPVSYRVVLGPDYRRGYVRGSAGRRPRS
jgi:hypothetical protein